MDYEQALAAVRKLAAIGMNLGLDRVRQLLAALGDPQKNLRVVHVGGTNGKGSVAAMLTAVACAAGMRVGTFTSPHLTYYTERFLLDGEPVTRERFATLVTVHQDALAAAARLTRPTEFELHTALALQLFREERVDLAVLEVGLGGRLDSTNVVLPEVSVITNVSLDHQNYLGGTIGEIAREKAGIVKPGVPVVTAAEGEALDVIAAACGERGAPLVRVGTDVRWEPVAVSPQGQTLNIHGWWGRYRVHLPLAGRHQQVNAACAVAGAELLAVREPALGPA
ncbi:MAG: bifunctional folylpolyglutamate synthase/dihydrofolate synthase, partial [Candidatus Desulforudis sp.]|nr:bifunctional folylpolyglutamate synthase/dihydrofolate synthase [Desulforudis sp.]